MEVFNKALLMKWRWRLLLEPNSLWGKILHAKYGAGDRTRDTRWVGRGSWWWRDIGKLRGEELDVFEECVRLKVGDGGNSLFWHDRWSRENGPLKQQFSRLFAISDQKLCTIREMGEWVEGIWRWRLSWRRNLFV